MSPVDMSPEAITRRLKKAAQLRNLCLMLGKAKPVEPSGEMPAKTSERDRDESPAAADR